MEDKGNKIKALTQQLEQGIRNVFTSERWKEYLATAAKFHSYSYGNVMLILSQRPGATRVAGFTAWRDKFGRTVNRGEKGIAIMAPAPYKYDVQREVINSAGEITHETITETRMAFKVAYVFDVSQTSGKELPRLVDELQADVAEYDTLMGVLKKVAAFPVEIKEIEGEARGYCSFAEGKIVLKQGMSESQTVKTLLHEMAHASLHGRKEGEATEKGRPSRHTMEVEAESIAYMVGQHLGLDSSEYTFGYIARWSSGKELPELKKSLETIQTHSRTMIDAIGREYETGKTRLSQEVKIAPIEGTQAPSETTHFTVWGKTISTGRRQQGPKRATIDRH